MGSRRRDRVAHGYPGGFVIQETPAQVAATLARSQRAQKQEVPETHSVATEFSASQSPRPARPSRAGSLIPILTSGLVVAIYEVVAAASMAALIFSGELSPDVARGVGFALFGAAITGVMIALLGSLPGTIGGVQDAPAAIMALIAGAIIATLPSGASADERFMTVVAAIAISTLLTGACLLAIGYFRLGNLVRFLPYPVVGGFLAGTGWLLFSGGLGMMSGLTLTVANLAQFFEPDVLLLWLPGLLWAIIAFLAMRRFEHALVLPGLIAAGIILFYLVAWLANASPAQLSQQGLLLGPFPEGRMWQPPSFDDLGLINWQAILSQAPAFGTIVILSLVGVLLNSSGLEVTFRKDVNLNRELRAAGIGNLLSGLGAGIIAFQQLSGSALSLGLKAASRWVGIMAAAVCGLFLLFGGSTLSLFPKGILGGLLLLVGLSFLYDWLVPAWSRLPRQDYAVVVIILITTAVVGFLQAVLLGLLIAIILFVVSYSWADVVRAEMSGATFPSRVTRSRQQQALLDQAADQLVIFQLQGFIFFGTAQSICGRVKQRIEERPDDGPRYVILDFARVTGLDSTASISFTKLIQDAGALDVKLGISAPGATIWQQMVQAGLCEPGDGFKVFSTLDTGVEWCEEQILASLAPEVEEPAPALVDQLAEILGDPAGAATLMHHMERMQLDAGQQLMAEGDPADTVYFVESGRVTAQLPRQDGQPLRLQSMGSGHVIGEIGFYLGGSRTADVVADEASVVYRLSLQDLEQMQDGDPRAASTLHRLTAMLLAERVVHLTAIVESASGDDR